jgi:glycosyltransferase involved in cell wall biosynthesis
MSTEVKTRLNILYVFGGEKAQGAEIVIERLIACNTAFAQAHLILSPGPFASRLLHGNKPYRITTIQCLKKLNRSNSGKAAYLLKGISNYFRVSFQVLNYIIKNKIDVVHANTIVPASYLIPAVIFTRVLKPNLKWVWSDHDMKYFSSIENWLSKTCASLYHRTLVVSCAVGRKYANNKNVLVLYNGLDTFLFKPDDAARTRFRAALGVAPDIIIIGIAASINPDKGQLELINAFNSLDIKNKACRLVLAGSYAEQFPGYAAAVQKLIAEAKDIIHCGYVEHITDFYNGCDILVNNSNDDRSESLGTSIYEAMACQKVVIATNTGGTPEIITDKMDGLLIAPGEPKQLERKLEQACGMYSSLGYLRSAARQRVMERFNILSMVEHYNQIIAGLQQKAAGNTYDIG